MKAKSRCSAVDQHDKQRRSNVPGVRIECQAGRVNTHSVRSTTFTSKPTEISSSGPASRRVHPPPDPHLPGMSGATSSTLKGIKQAAASQRSSLRPMVAGGSAIELEGVQEATRSARSSSVKMKPRWVS